MPHQNISDIIKMLRRGGTDSELGAAFEEVKQAAERSQKRCSLVITLHVEPLKDDLNGDQIIILDEHQIKLPKSPPRQNFLYVEPESGKVQSTDPQLTMTEVLSNTKTAPSETAPDETVKKVDEGEIRSVESEQKDGDA